MGRWIAGLVAAGVVALAPAAASAAAPSPFGLACNAQSDGVRVCQGDGSTQRVTSWDGTPLDVDVTLPASGDGPFPTIVMLHGWGGSKKDFESTSPDGGGPVRYHYNNDFYAQQGYAVVNYSARGWGASCGGGGAPAAQLQTGACMNGFIRLADQRYEVRDTQYLLGKLVDAGIAKAGALGVTGISYGGGQSIELAYLKDRIRCSGLSVPGDPCNGRGVGALLPWKSPVGTPLSITAAYPRWPWSDLVSSLLPNGRFLDFDTGTDGTSRSPIGVEIQSYLAGLFALGNSVGYIESPLPPNTGNAWDLTSQFALINAGEPYEANPMAHAIADETFNYHQGFGIPDSSPAPLLLESGWNDDLFPPAQSLRVYDDLRAHAPNADVALMLGDVGHMRGSNKQAVNQNFNDQAAAFFAAHLRGAGTAAAPGSVTAFTTTCPQAVPDGGPYVATSWDAIHPGAVVIGTPGAQSVLSSGGSSALSAQFDPITNGDGCKTVAAETDPGTAVYTAHSLGFTLLGLPTIGATINTTGNNGQLDARLWDVTPDGHQLLVTRGGYRLLDNQSGAIKFQLHGNGYRFAAGDTVKLELVGSDAPYYRASNGAFSVNVQNLVVELPVAERPGTTPQIVAPGTLTGVGRSARCVGPRAIRVPLPHGRGTQVLSATVFINGRRMRVWRGRAVRGRAITLHNVAAGTVRVRIRYRIKRHGATRRAVRTRTYRVCKRGKPAKRKHKRAAKRHRAARRH